ncbi:MAG: hypothetical protein KBD06_00830 [Candidatus Pacebacteria bacterium]|nr:hypothetical protein [Candidatus Paceibacterota bacterium]
MDDNKDIQKTESLSKFFDSQNVRVNPFGDNRAADRAYRRAERISAAVHLLTNHIDASEPLRQSVRRESMQMLVSVLGVRNEMRSSQSGVVVAVTSSIRHLISLVRMLAISGFASTQNVGAIVEALDELGNFMQVSQRTNFSESIIISKDELLDVGTLAPRAAAISVRDIKDTRIVGERAEVKEESVPVVKAAVQNGQTSVRTQSILEILKSSGSMGIKDICSNLPEYSEKMIQRELLTLVADGRVMKTGLKRWSRYSVS